MPLSAGSQLDGGDNGEVVARIKTYARSKPLWHTLREEPIALHPIHTEALKMAVCAEEAESVTIGKAGGACYIEGIAAQFFDSTYKLA